MYNLKKAQIFYNKPLYYASNPLKYDIKRKIIWQDLLNRQFHKIIGLSFFSICCTLDSSISHCFSCAFSEVFRTFSLSIVQPFSLMLRYGNF
jgi:hypothetical protein